VRPIQRRRGPYWLILAVTGCLALLCVAILLVLGILYLRDRDSGFEPSSVPETSTPLPATTQVNSPTVTLAAQGELVEPTAAQIEPTAAQIEAPVLETPTPVVLQAGPAGTGNLSSQQQFTRWFLDYSLLWELGETDVYITDINQDQSWVIGLKQPQSLVLVIPPHPQAYYPRNVSVTVNVKPGDLVAAGPYGLACHFQDENNYYLVEIQGDSYGIGKIMQGTFTPLTEPYWQASQFIEWRDGDGFVELGVTCADYAIGVSINGLGETYPVDDPGQSFSGGAVLLMTGSSQQPIDMLMGIFYFKDLVIEPFD
jgi:hypothetical protein